MALIVLQGKVLPEVLTKFKEAQENSGSETFNQFVEEILEAYLNPKTKNVEVPRPTADQLQEITLKDNEIGRLKMDIDFKVKEIETLRAENSELNHENETLNNNASGILLGENQEVLTIPPIVGLVLDREAATALKKSGQQFTRGDILLNSFWESITNGAAHPFRIWSSSELAALKKQLQSGQ